jgi:hypothetical protein
MNENSDLKKVPSNNVNYYRNLSNVIEPNIILGHRSGKLDVSDVILYPVLNNN